MRQQLVLLFTAFASAISPSPLDALPSAAAVFEAVPVQEVVLGVVALAVLVRHVQAEQEAYRSRNCMLDAASRDKTISQAVVDKVKSVIRQLNHFAKNWHDLPLCEQKFLWRSITARRVIHYACFFDILLDPDVYVFALSLTVYHPVTPRPAAWKRELAGINMENIGLFGVELTALILRSSSPMHWINMLMSYVIEPATGWALRDEQDPVADPEAQEFLQEEFQRAVNEHLYACKQGISL